jgi:hypothetical protein
MDRFIEALLEMFAQIFIFVLFIGSMWLVAVLAGAVPCK